MKIIITESQYKTLTEENSWWSTLLSNVENAFTTTPAGISYYLLKTYLKKFGSDNIKRVRLIFPQQDWEMSAVKLMKNLGVVTGVYDSLTSAEEYCNTLVSKNIKADEFVIGSHGNGKSILMTKESGDLWNFETSFLNSFKPLITQNTKVFFTACHGADYLLTLKNAADVLGVTVYGSQGIYNYVTNTSENGFYWCSTKPVQKFTISNVKKLPTYSVYYNTLTNVWIPNLDKNEVDVILTIDPKIFGINIPPIKKRISSNDREYIATIDYNKNGEPIYAYPFNINSTDFIDSNLFNKIRKIGGDSVYEYFGKNIIGNISNGRVKIEFVTKNGLVNLLSLKPLTVKSKDDVNNDYLLKNKVCGKASSAPISWL